MRLVAAALAMLALPATASADVADFLGKRLADVRVEVGGQETSDRAVVDLVETTAGEPLTMRDIRETIDHLTGLGQFDDIRVLAAPAADNGVRLTWRLVALQQITRVRFAGSPMFSDGDLQAAIAGRATRTLSPSRVPLLIETLERFYADRGYRAARITPGIVATGRTNDVVLQLEIVPGTRTTVGRVTVSGRPLGSEADVLEKLRLEPGVAYDRPELERREALYEEELRGQGYYEAAVDHTESAAADGPVTDVVVNVDPGPRVRVVFAGDPLPAAQRDALVPVRQERSLEEDLLEDAVRNIERYLRNEGYRDGTARFMRSEENGELVLTFTVTRGVLHRLESWTVEGAGSLTAADLAPLLRLTAGEPFVGERVATVASAITELYHVRGFASAAVTADTPAQPVVADGNTPYRPVTATFLVQEGVRTDVSDVVIEGATSLGDTRVRPLLGLTEGRPFYRPQLDADREAIERLYLNEGFQRAVIRETLVPADGDTRVAVRWNVQEGPRTRVDHVLVTGNERTDAAVIRREITLRPGDPLGNDALIESQRRLSGLGLFRRVRITALLHGAGDDRDLLVDVEEAPPTTISYGGGLELQPRARRSAQGTADDALEFAPRAFFEIGRRNLWGKNRSVNLFTRASIRRRDNTPDDPDPTGSSGYGLYEYRVVGTFREPRAFRTPGDVQLTSFVEQAVRASFSFRRRGARAEYARRLATRFTVSGRYNFDWTDLFDTQIALADRPLVDRLFPQVRLSTLTGSVLRDTRDDVLDPQRGLVLGVDGSMAARSIGSEVGFLRSFAQSFFYRRLPGRSRFVFATGARLGIARGIAREVAALDENGEPVVDENGLPVLNTIRSLPASERFFAGGDTTVRGFAIDRLGSDETLDANGFAAGGNGLLVVNAELRSPYWKGLGLVGFVDGGNVFRLASDITLSELRGAAGFGVRYRSPIGPLRVDLGFKLDPRTLSNGSRERGAILHVSLGQAF